LGDLNWVHKRGEEGRDRKKKMSGGWRGWEQTKRGNTAGTQKCAWGICKNGKRSRSTSRLKSKPVERKKHRKRGGPVKRRRTGLTKPQEPNL